MTAKASAALKGAGYAVLHNVFDDKLVGELRTTSDEMSEAAKSVLATHADSSRHAAEQRDALIVVPEAAAPTQVCRYEYMIGSTPKFRRLVESVIAPVVADVLGSPVVPFKDKTNEKAPGGGAFGPHQDFAAYQYFPPRFHVTALLSIDRATEENGCVQFATNYRALGTAESTVFATPYGPYPLFPFHTGGKENGDIVAPVANRFTWESVILSPNDLVLFDSFVPHYSEANASAAPRRAMFLTFNAAFEGEFYEAYYSEKRRNYHDPKFHVSTPTLRRIPAETM